MRIELIYDSDCPNVERARANLVEALRVVGSKDHWSEWNRSDPNSPEPVRKYGSPTVLVNGKDVAQSESEEMGASCHLYRTPEGMLQPAPTVEQIKAALREATQHPGMSWHASAATVPGIVVSLLPKVACPACWPAYAGVLGSLGLGFLLKEAYLFPLTVAFLVIALAALGYRARVRRGYGPFLLGVLAGTAIALGTLGTAPSPVTYAGVVTLVSASLWNAWPRRHQVASCCQTPAAQPEQLRSLRKET